MGTIAKAAAVALACLACTTSASAAASTPYAIGNELLSVTVLVGPSGTCVSTMALNLSLAGDPPATSAFTTNLLAGGESACSNRSSSTSLEVASDPRQLALPTGGTVVSSNASGISITGISVSSGVATVATEDWDIVILLTPNGAAASLVWRVRRTFLQDGTALTDLFPALWMTSTSGSYEPTPGASSSSSSSPSSSSPSSSPSPVASPPLWRDMVQMPSFFSTANDLLNYTAGTGYAAASGALSSVVGDETAGAAQMVMLSPSSIWMQTSLAACRFTMTRYTDSWFTQQLGVGAECAAGPGDAYAFFAGDSRSNEARLDFYASANGAGLFDLALPPASPAGPVVDAARTFTKIYFMLMGWLNGNSPASTTCIHEASLFSQLQGVLRLTPPPSDAPTGISAISQCGGLSNPFCGRATSVDTVLLTLECADGATITAIDAAYGLPTLSGPSSSSCNLTRSPTCDDASFQAYATSLCVGQTGCTLNRSHADPDPCPYVQKAIAAVATCSSAAGGRVPPLPGQCPGIHGATAKHLDFILATSVNASGWIAARWDIVGGNTWMDIIDQQPNVVLMAYYHAVNTNDTEAVRRWMPALNLIASFMEGAMLVNSTSVLTNTIPACNGVANFSCADNWLDDVRAGWQDAIVGLYAVEAFRALGDLRRLVGDVAGSEAAYATHAKMVAAYNAAFWNETLGLYHDWVDVGGNARSYFYTWHNFLAIEMGVASPQQASAILATADRLYGAIYASFNKTAADLWCTPTNLIPLSPDDLTVDFDSEYVFPHYENGDCFGWHSGIESLARARASGTGAPAYARLSQAMLGTFNTSRLWAQRYSWLSGSVQGSDVITDAGFLLYGGLMGALNIRTSLFGGVEVLGPAAPELEGAVFTFGLGGQDVSVKVESGWASVVGAK